jgi:hypothetical protein
VTPDEALTELARLREERIALLRRIDSLEEERNTQRNTVPVLIVALLASLQTYGRHKQSCKSYRGLPECDCGFGATAEEDRR